ncbi:hypothetical protein L7D45_22740 [Brucella pseudogrignonensis]|jgi:hypothetical protein|uniref:hypothetical protein n=1 Tax=Brucella TaxID=234 RepID=UPI0013AF79E3|nr:MULTISPECIES: hypothetical protein [Brucella]MBK0022538.1 hypothetical protein [Ochrobactrum sp. S45]MBK0044553.1 hypothetical protein [Ochrobactrum sp. S46]UKK95489.1 hypothetical protein L7D45_22740 [Brucella pseudogrignonensis]
MTGRAMIAWQGRGQQNPGPLYALAPGDENIRPVCQNRAEVMRWMAPVSIMQQQPGENHAGGDLHKPPGQRAIEKWANERPGIPTRSHCGIAKNMADQLSARDATQRPCHGIDDEARIRNMDNLARNRASGYAAEKLKKNCLHAKSLQERFNQILKTAQIQNKTKDLPA